jgi:peptidyl-Lys metalloendopeptidase
MMDVKNQNSRVGTILVGIAILLVSLAIPGHTKSLFSNSQLASAKTPMSAVVNLSVDKDSFDEGADVIVHVTIKNPTRSSIRILKWFTPLDGVERPLFTVLRNGEAVPYVGKLVKRAAPKERDYITLKAGKSMRSDVKLSDYYAFLVPGRYEITYNVTSPQLYLENGIGRSNDGRLGSNIVNLVVKGRVSLAH